MRLEGQMHRYREMYEESEQTQQDIKSENRKLSRKVCACRVIQWSHKSIWDLLDARALGCDYIYAYEWRAMRRLEKYLFKVIPQCIISVCICILSQLLHMRFSAGFSGNSGSKTHCRNGVNMPYRSVNGFDNKLSFLSCVLNRLRRAGENLTSWRENVNIWRLE